MKSMSVDGKRVWVTEYIQCTTECGLEAGDQSAARLAQLIIGYVGGCVHAEGSARELILYTKAILIKPTMKKSKFQTMILVHTVSMFSGYMGPRASKNSFTA